jgi:signal transduction histidine kinase
MRSIGQRIYRTIALISLVSLLLLVMITAWVSVDLESTMLRVELAQQRDFFVNEQLEPGTPIQHDYAGMMLVYVPDHATSGQTSTDTATASVPLLFRGLQTPYSGELSYNNETYLVDIQAVRGGTLYLARNITHFERREWMFRFATLVAALLVALLISILALMGAKRVVKPLQRLSEQIQAMQAGTRMGRLPAQWEDSELQTIALSFNEFVAQLEAYVRREKSLLNLASHELRTPLAVVSGALDILEQRASLSARDQTTLARIRNASDEMQTSIDILLALARKNQTDRSLQDTLTLANEIDGTLAALAATHPVALRLEVRTFVPGYVRAEKTMVRMLLRNLIHNALQHTQHRVYITLQDDYLEIRDEGEGLSPQAQDVLEKVRTLEHEEGPVHGLGLYLVTLMTERLGWQLHIVQTSERGTVLRVFYSDH